MEVMNCGKTLNESNETLMKKAAHPKMGCTLMYLKIIFTLLYCTVLYLYCIKCF